jgi:serine/threonine protein kinase
MSDLRAALADALGPLYRVEREVRPVGDDRLFVVTQSPAGPELLVKVLPAAASLAIDDRHFERDLLLLADRLQHPNLVPPKGGGRAGTCIFHSRAFVAGTTLRAWIDRHGALPLTRGVEVLRAVLAGLAHAHAARIVHGDLRAESVLLGADGVILADAGIATLLGRPGTRRNDMVALGALAHHMFAGRPFRVGDEPLGQSRSFPPWLATWLETQWGHAGEAFAGFGTPT